MYIIVSRYQKSFSFSLARKIIKEVWLLWYPWSGQLIVVFLNGPTQYVSFASTTSTNKQINYGIPQGSILGPLFFLST